MVADPSLMHPRQAPVLGFAVQILRDQAELWLSIRVDVLLASESGPFKGFAARRRGPAVYQKNEWRRSTIRPY
jgi:hypothetical protein